MRTLSFYLPKPGAIGSRDYEHYEPALKQQASNLNKIWVSMLCKSDRNKHNTPALRSGIWCPAPAPAPAGGASRFEALYIYHEARKLKALYRPVQRSSLFELQLQLQNSEGARVDGGSCNLATPPATGPLGTPESTRCTVVL